MPVTSRSLLATAQLEVQAQYSLVSRECRALSVPARHLVDSKAQEASVVQVTPAPRALGHPTEQVSRWHPAS